MIQAVSAIIGVLTLLLIGAAWTTIVLAAHEKSEQ